MRPVTRQRRESPHTNIGNPNPFPPQQRTRPVRKYVEPQPDISRDIVDGTITNLDQPLNQARFKSLCHFFNTKQGCRLGNQCGFVHKVITPHVTICHFYGTEKGCQAAKCGFIHQ